MTDADLGGWWIRPMSVIGDAGRCWRVYWWKSSMLPTSFGQTGISNAAGGIL